MNGLDSMTHSTYVCKITTWENCDCSILIYKSWLQLVIYIFFCLIATNLFLGFSDHYYSVLIELNEVGFI